MARRKADPSEAAEVIEGLLALVDSGELTCATRRERAVVGQLRGAATALRAFGQAGREEPGAGAWTWGPARRPGPRRPGAPGRGASEGKLALAEYLARLDRSNSEFWALVRKTARLRDGSASAAAAISVLRSVLRADQDLATTAARAGWATRNASGAVNQKRAGDARVARILELAGRGLSLRAICRALDAEGVPRLSNRSRAWPVASVQYVINTYAPAPGEVEAMPPGA